MSVNMDEYRSITHHAYRRAIGELYIQLRRHFNDPELLPGLEHAILSLESLARTVNPDPVDSGPVKSE